MYFLINKGFEKMQASEANSTSGTSTVFPPLGDQKSAGNEGEKTAIKNGSKGSIILRKKNRVGLGGQVRLGFFFCINGVLA